MVAENNVFDARLIQERKVVVISVQGELRDGAWSGRFGQVQSTVLEADSDYLVWLDLTMATWMDPFPILSLAILLMQRHEQTSKKGKILFEREPVLLFGEKLLSRQRLFKFMALQGFMDCFKTVTDFHGCSDAKELIKYYSNQGSNTVYHDPECIHAEILTLKGQPNGLEPIIYGLVSGAHERGIAHWFKGNEEEVCHRLYGLLSELLFNVHEHAYSQGETCYVGIYARIRHPRPTTNAKEAKIWDLYQYREGKFSPTLKEAASNPSDHRLELFLCDLGRGIASKINDWHPNHASQKAISALAKAKKSDAPLRILAEHLLSAPYSSTDRTQKNRVTGLQQVGISLDVGKDFIRIFSNGEWVGDRAPWEGAKHVGAIQVCKLHEYRDLKRTYGTYVGIILRPDGYAQSHLPEYWVAMEDDDSLLNNHTTSKRESLIQSLMNPPLSKIDASVTLVDERAEKKWCRFPAKYIDPTSTLEQRRLIGLDDTKTLIWLPTEFVDKRVLADWLSTFVGAAMGYMEGATGHGIQQLIIADLSRHVGINLAWLMEETGGRTGKSLDVVIVTREWNIAYYSKNNDENNFIHSVTKANEFITRSCENPFSAGYLLRLLRHIDSQIFWSSLWGPNDHTGGVFFTEWIDWLAYPDDEKFHMGGYLDFAQAITDPVRFAVCERATLRALNVFGTQFRVYPADDLGRSVMEKTNRLWDRSQVSDQLTKGCRTIVLGSVYVTGSTINALGDIQGICVSYKLNILKHNAIYPAEHIEEKRGVEVRPPHEEHIFAALDWLPVPDRDFSGGDKPWGPINGTLRYMRIPGTPFICRGGEKHIPLPRFKKPIPSDNELVSLYGQSANDTYRLWYRLRVLKLGHWVYGERHDLLTINLAKAYRLDSLDNGPVSKWLHESFAEYFRLKEGHSLRGILLYPSHPVTDRIVQDFSRPNSPLAGVIVIPIKFYSRHSTSPLRYSPLTDERLRNAIAEIKDENKSNSAQVIVFDDGTVTGKAFRELTLMAIAMGAKPENIHRMALLDRSGLPIHQESTEYFTNRNFRLWRWDVPDLGQKRACLLCNTLSVIASRAASISNHTAKKRLNEWCKEIWAPRSVVDAWDQTGGWLGDILEPDSESRYGQRFGIVYKKNDVTLHETLSPNPGGYEPAFQKSISPDQDTPMLKRDTGNLDTPLEEYVYPQNSTSLAALTVELRRNTTNRNYALKKANNVALNFTPETRLEILCCQVLLFFDAMTEPERVDYLGAIVSWLCKVGQDTPMSALAGLCLSLADNRLARLLFKTVSEFLEKTPPKLDPLLGMGLLREAWERSDDDSSPPLLVNSNVTQLMDILFAQEKGAREALSELFMILGADSREGHNTPLHSILLNLAKIPDESTVEEFFTRDMLSASIYLEGLKTALVALPASFLHCGKTGCPNIREHVKKLNELLENFQSIINLPQTDSLPEIRCWAESVLQVIFSSDATVGGLSQQYQDAIILKLNKDEIVGNFLIDHLGDSWHENASRKIKNIYRNSEKLDITTKHSWHDRSGKLLLIPTIVCMDQKKKWLNDEVILMSPFVRMCLRDVVMNGVHADALILNPSDPKNETAHLWWDAKLIPRGIEFRFVNACKNADFIPEWLVYFDYLRHFGGDVSLSRKLAHFALQSLDEQEKTILLPSRKLVEITLTIPNLATVIGSAQ